MCVCVNMCPYMYEAAEQAAPSQGSSDGPPEHPWGPRRRGEGVGNAPRKILHSFRDNSSFQTAIRTNQPLRTDRHIHKY